MDPTGANITSFAPEGETAFDLWIEKSFLDGYALAAVGYGVLLALTWQTMHSFFSLPQKSRPWGLVGYAAMIFALATIGFGSATKINERSFVQDRNAPGGPSGFEVISFASPVNMMGVVAYVMLSWIADGLVLWRFWLVWGSNYVYTIFPAMMLLGSVATSLALIVTSFQVENSFWAARSVQFGTAYWSLSISLNILLTLLIAGRILVIRRRIKRSLGAQHAQKYFSAAAMIIESASLYAVVGLIFIVTYARSSSVQNLVFPALGQVQGIAPMLILSRVAQGRAWSQSTIQATTALSINGANGASTTNIALGSLASRQGAGLDSFKGVHMVTDKHTDSDSLPYTARV
ncbi:hypothetical protein MIND_01314700 [Mycena indigotica]|uniref:Uncharacterized protein n=1 Tax=Mycena indigotica TaxID=2126181 RepID=A0A8H6S3P4_9AGAR|nr:uncharacterized protein MIND_01314700 [Mycena indigotica]KAF7290740.1 hypothetical protein MIND_01314700 [Mycena indigotica]